jgi:hypothetical protein
MVGDLLASPVLRRVLCEIEPVFSFNPRSRIQARINRAELGEFDSLVLGLFLIGQYKGQVVVPALGFYGRDVHTSLIRENRLIAGVNYLDELKRKAPELREAVLLMKEKAAKGATFKDAVELAEIAGLRPDFMREDNDYNRFIQGAMGVSEL